MQKHFAKILLVAYCAQIGCASITASRTDRLSISGSPPGATVTVDGSMSGSVPLTVEVPRQKRTAVQISAPGYRTASCDTSMSAGGGYIAADVILCVLLFPLGCISFIDAGGAWNELQSPSCNVVLAPETASPAHARMSKRAASAT